MHRQMLRNIFLDPGRLFVKELELTNTVDMNSAPTVLLLSSESAIITRTWCLSGRSLREDKSRWEKSDTESPPSKF
jgi:hypothetical protein